MNECPDQRDKYGFTPKERGHLSLEGSLCGMSNCSVPPEQVCPACSMWYCVRDFPSHFAGYPEHREAN